MFDFIIIVLLIALAVAAYVRYRDPLYPAFLQAVLWASVTTMFFLTKDVFSPVSETTYFIIVNGVFTFSLGSYISTYGYRPAMQRIGFEQNGASILLFLVFFIPILMLPLFVQRLVQLGANGFTGVLLVDVRAAVTFNRYGGFGLLAYAVPFSFLSAALHLLLLERTYRSVLKFSVSAAVALVYGFCTTGRTAVFLLIIVVVGIPTITRRITPRAGLLYCLGSMVAAFVGVAIALHKGGDSHVSLAANANAIWHSLRIYLLGGLPAFDQLVRSSPRAHFGQGMFRLVFVLCQAVGFNVHPVDLVQRFTKVPSWTNVYTLYQVYFEDFSYVGVGLVQFAFGMWHGYLYRKADTGRPMFICLYAIFLYPLFMQFFQDQYFSLASLWIQFAACFGFFFSFQENCTRVPARYRSEAESLFMHSVLPE